MDGGDDVPEDWVGQDMPGLLANEESDHDLVDNSEPIDLFAEEPEDADEISQPDAMGRARSQSTPCAEGLPNGNSRTSAKGDTDDDAAPRAQRRRPARKAVLDSTSEVCM
jgi:hypothetical protein